MSQTDPAARTVLAYQEGDASGKKLFAVLDQVNELTEDIFDFCTLMDADTGITLTTYLAQLTGAQVDYTGYTTTVATPTPVRGLLRQFDPLEQSEEVYTKCSEEMNKHLTDIDTVIALLNTDGGVTATNFDESGWRSFRLIQRATIGEDQDAVENILMMTDAAHFGELLAICKPDATNDGQLYRSTDDGRSWHQLATFAATITDFKGFIQHGKNLFLFGNTAAAEVVYKSVDYGVTWTVVTTGVTLASNAFTDAMVTSNGVILASGAAGGEVLRSPDGGITWTEVIITGPTGVNSLAEESGGKVMACGDDASLYSSTDDGAVFAEENDFSGGNVDNLIAFLQLANGWWLVTGHDGDGTDELITSDDDGTTWETPVAVTGAQDELGRMAQAADGNVYIQVGVDMQVSEDNGATVNATALDFPANDTGHTNFARNRHGEILGGTLNATDFGGIWLIGALATGRGDAYGDAVAGGFPILLAQSRDGYTGTWLDWYTSQYQLLLQKWQALGAMMDVDTDIVTTTYEAAIAVPLITPLRVEATGRPLNQEHGASA